MGTIVDTSKISTIVKMASKFRQDMPPEGGYREIRWSRVFRPTKIGGYKQFGLFFAITGFGWGLVALDKHRRRAVHVEMTDARSALEPFMVAERQRMYLRHLRENRDEERELMKDVP